MTNITPEMLIERKIQREARFPGFGKPGDKTPEIRLKKLEDRLFGPNYYSPRREEGSELNTEPTMLKPARRAKRRKNYCSRPPRP